MPRCDISLSKKTTSNFIVEAVVSSIKIKRDDHCASTRKGWGNLVGKSGIAWLRPQRKYPKSGFRGMQLLIFG